MKNIFFTLILCCSFLSVLAQRISKISISGQGNTDLFSVTTDDNALLNVSPEGNLVSYGVEYFSEKISNYSRLEKFNGRIDLYTATDDKMLMGKLKYIGRTAIIYYASYDLESLRGKIKNIGNLTFTYFMHYDDESMRGKIKSIGNSQISYFTGFDNVALRGKLKTLGSTNLNYFSSFDDIAFAGKIKSIGQVSFTYYTSFEKQFAGAMKTGNQNQNISGINYIIQ